MDDDTPPQPDEQLPGYGAGFTDGYRLGLLRAVGHLRDALKEGGTAPTEALLLAERFRAWIIKKEGLGSL